jgi:hypothetical protein
VHEDYEVTLAYLLVISCALRTFVIADILFVEKFFLTLTR